MLQMASAIKAADCFVIVSPEYNHSIPSALSAMMSHFGGSNYAYKMSAIVTYSAGPWGGMRAAVALRPFLSELGCLPVSKLTGIPVAHELLDDHGVPRDASNRMFNQLPSMLEQLEWFTIACMNQRSVTGV
jgi:chromate reductase